MSKRFEGKVALVTGGASGIGRSAALLFGAEGASVVIADIDEVAGNEMVHELENHSASALFVRTDVSKSDEVEKLIDQTIQRFGKLDCAVNNAGILGTFGGIAQQTEESFDVTIAVNLKGVWLCMKHEILVMRGRTESAIVNVSSVNGISSSIGAPIYSASKFAVLGLTKSAALEYASAGIRINAVCPGAVQTPMLKRSFGSALLALPMQIPIKRIGTPHEIAEAILWLCSGSASYVTGHVLICDGGVLAQQ